MTSQQISPLTGMVLLQRNPARFQPPTTVQARSFSLEQLTLVGSSALFQNAVARTRRAALEDSLVIFRGESGTSKDYLAKMLHHWSSRSAKPLHIWQSQACPETLARTELFGAAKGSHSTATMNMKGLLDAADGSTLILPDLDRMALDLQAALLLYLDERAYRAVGSAQVILSNVRLVVTSNRNLESLVQQGLLMQDLFFRLSGIVIETPSYRERPEDIRELVEALMRGYSQGQVTIDPGAMDLLMAQPLPGNIREIDYIVKNLVFEAMPHGRIITLGAVRAFLKLENNAMELDRLLSLPLRERRKAENLKRGLMLMGGNQALMAKRLEIPLRTLRRDLQHLGWRKKDLLALSCQTSGTIVPNGL